MLLDPRAAPAKRRCIDVQIRKTGRKRASGVTAWLLPASWRPPPSPAGAASWRARLRRQCRAGGPDLDNELIYCRGDRHGRMEQRAAGSDPLASSLVFGSMRHEKKHLHGRASAACVCMASPRCWRHSSPGGALWLLSNKQIALCSTGAICEAESSLQADLRADDRS